MGYSVLCLLAFLGMACGQGIIVPETDMVASIRQNYQLSTNTNLLGMIKRYQDAEKIFKAYESFLKRGDVVLPCFSKWAGRMANEIWRQKEILLDIMKTRGGAPKYYSVNLMNACQNIVVDTAARLGDNSDNTRMCICEKLLEPAAAFTASRLGATCPATSPRWQYGKLVVEDALATLRYLNLHANALTRQADLAMDVQVESTLRIDILGKLRDVIWHTTDHVNALRKFAPTNYILGEYDYDRNEMCKTDINFKNKFLGANFDRFYS